MAFLICLWEKNEILCNIITLYLYVSCFEHFLNVPTCPVFFLLLCWFIFLSRLEAVSNLHILPTQYILVNKRLFIIPNSTGETLNGVCNIFISILLLYLWTRNLLFSEKCGVVPWWSARSVYMPVPNGRLQTKRGRYLVMNMLGRQEHPLWEQHQLQGLANLLYRIPAAQLCTEEAAKSVQSKRVCYVESCLLWLE